MLSGTPKQKKESTFKAPWNSSTKPIKKNAKPEKSSPLTTFTALQSKFIKLTRSSKQTMSPALSNSSSYSKLNEFDSNRLHYNLNSSLNGSFQSSGSGNSMLNSQNQSESKQTLSKKPLISLSLSHSTSLSKINQPDPPLIVQPMISTTNSNLTDFKLLQRRSVSFATPAQLQHASPDHKPALDVKNLSILYERLLSTNNISDRELKSSAKQLRMLVRLHGLPVNL